MEPLLRLTVRDAKDQAHAVDAVIDTGYNGFLTLPPATIAGLGLSWLCRQHGRLADGSILVFDAYVAVIEWEGKRRIVEVEATDSYPLLGTAMLEGSELRISVVSDGTLSITPISGP